MCYNRQWYGRAQYRLIIGRRGRPCTDAGKTCQHVKRMHLLHTPRGSTFRDYQFGKVWKIWLPCDWKHWHFWTFSYRRDFHVWSGWFWHIKVSSDPRAERHCSTRHLCDCGRRLQFWSLFQLDRYSVGQIRWHWYWRYQANFPFVEPANRVRRCDLNEQVRSHHKWRSGKNQENY